ncbi:hypothetical protein Lalb_Chr11g0072601 [Lupinus albus]|uniref:Uncharacterized protein n=1 Tax=Lupinus albus TaxID=3870 RepID=A0A6A4PSP9_LUPAL|nr:hypothetical protein Lalb_Chr11g0072601 [Lupinus albus]
MTCVAVGTTTMFVVGRRGWYYDGCAKCTKKADVKDGPFICKCGHFNQISIPRWTGTLRIYGEPLPTLQTPRRSRWRMSQLR